MLKKLLVSVMLLSLIFIPVYGFGETNPTETKPSEDESKAPKGDLPNWKQVFVDDFDEYGDVPVGSFSNCNHQPSDSKQAFCSGLKEPLKSRWWAYPKGWPDTSRQRKYPVSGQYNPDETISIEDGKMKVVMKSDGKENQVAALVPKATMEQTYGRYVIRFKTDATPGYKIAWLLWPVNEEACPGCEIDFPEMELDREIAGFMHHKLKSKDDPNIQDSYKTDQKSEEWHTAVTEWSPGKVEFFLDGKKVKGINPEGKEIETSTVNVPDQPMTWVIQSESALDERAKNNEVVAKNNSTATILIDWVAAYTYKGNENGQDQTSKPDEEGKDEDQSPKPDEEGKDEDQSPKPDEEGKDRDQSPKPDEEGKDKDQSPKPDEEGKDEEQSPKPDEEDQTKKQENKLQPKININPVILDNERVEININLENVNDPKGNWLLSFHNEEPKRYEDKGATLKETFGTKNLNQNEVQITAEFEGKDADGEPIQVKVSENIKVKDSTDKNEEKVIADIVANKKIGGKLPKTDTNYHQGIVIGVILSLLGLFIFSLFVVRKQV